MKYRKKPVIVEATQWFKNGDHPDDYSKDEPGPTNGEMYTFTREERRAHDWEGDIAKCATAPCTITVG